MKLRKSQQARDQTLRGIPGVNDEESQKTYACNP